MTYLGASCCAAVCTTWLLITTLVIGPNLRFAGPPKRARNTFTAISPLSMPSHPRTLYLPASGVKLTRNDDAGGRAKSSTKNLSKLQHALQGCNLAYPRASRLTRDPTHLEELPRQSRRRTRVLIDDMPRPGTKIHPITPASVSRINTCSPFTSAAGDKAVRLRMLQRFRLMIFFCCAYPNTSRYSGRPRV